MTAGGRVFLDSNLFVYALDQRDAMKQGRCLELIAAVSQAGAGVVSTQVMQELFSAAMSKLRLSALQARGAVQNLGIFEVVVVSPAMIETGMELVALHGLSFWDALIVAAAAAANCAVIYSEDMQAGRKLLGLRIENPLA